MPSRVFRILSYGLHRRCPRCGADDLFQTHFHFRGCRVCNFNPAKSDARHGLRTLTVDMLISEAFAVGTVLTIAMFTKPNPPWAFLLSGGLVLAIGLPFLLYPFATCLFMAVGHALHVSGTHRLAASRRR